MKTIGRMIILLSCAMLIVGAVYGMGQTDWGSQLFSKISGGEWPEGEGFAPPDSEFTPPSGGFDRDAGGVASLSGIVEFAKTLIPITLIIVAFNQIPVWFQTARRRLQKVGAS